MKAFYLYFIAAFFLVFWSHMGETLGYGAFALSVVMGNFGLILGYMIGDSAND